jgi:hypothetical protein
MCVLWTWTDETKHKKGWGEHYVLVTLTRTLSAIATACLPGLIPALKLLAELKQAGSDARTAGRCGWGEGGARGCCW